MGFINVKFGVLLVLLICIAIFLATRPSTFAKGPDMGLQKERVVDMHVHVAGIGAGGSGCFISDELRKSWKYRVYLRAFGVTETEMIEKGDAIIIERLSRELAESSYVGSAVVLAMDGAIGDDGELDTDRTELYIPNEYVANEVRKYDNLHFGASINPYRKDSLDRLEQAAIDGAVLIKWLPSIQGINPSDEQIVPFYLRMKELGLPLLTHTGDEHSFTKARNELADPKHLRLPLSLGVNVIAAHVAVSGKNKGISNYERLLPMFEEYPNLYGDISSLTQINKVGSLSKVMNQKELQGRLIFGTDMPLIKTGLTSPMFYIFKLSPKTIYLLMKVSNPWDRDVMLKQALGVTDEVFMNFESVLPVIDSSVVKSMASKELVSGGLL